MQSPKKLCLQCNNFQENLNSAFQKFRNNQDFADVTLACKDGTHIVAHKLVLASSRNENKNCFEIRKTKQMGLDRALIAELRSIYFSHVYVSPPCVQYVYIGNVALWRPLFLFSIDFTIALFMAPDYTNS